MLIDWLLIICHLVNTIERSYDFVVNVHIQPILIFASLVVVYACFDDCCWSINEKQYTFFMKRHITVGLNWLFSEPPTYYEKMHYQRNSFSSIYTGKTCFTHTSDPGKIEDRNYPTSDQLLGDCSLVENAAHLLDGFDPRFSPVPILTQD